MSITKRIWIDKDPAYADVRAAAAQEFWDAVADYPERVPLRRKNRFGTRVRWDPTWPFHLRKAVAELRLDTISVNEGILFRSKADKTKAMALAEQRWRDDVARRAAASSKA